MMIFDRASFCTTLLNGCYLGYLTILSNRYKLFDFKNVDKIPISYWISKESIADYRNASHLGFLWGINRYMLEQSFHFAIKRPSFQVKKVIAIISTGLGGYNAIVQYENLHNFLEMKQSNDNVSWNAFYVFSLFTILYISQLTFHKIYLSMRARER